MWLRASVERQIVLAGLACIVLSVWHPILCGNSILWGWRKWDCGEWLHHCIRSCCWLLVTLKKGKRRKQLYTTEDGSEHQPEKQYTHTCSCEYPTHHHHNIAQSSINFSIKKSMPHSSEPWHCFLNLFWETFSLPGGTRRTNYGACKLHTPVISHKALRPVRHSFGRGKRHWNIGMEKETQTKEQGSLICLEVPYLGPFSSSLTLIALLTSKHIMWFRAHSSLLCYSERKEVLILKLICAAAPSFALAALCTEHGCSGTSRWNIPFALRWLCRRHQRAVGPELRTQAWSMLTLSPVLSITTITQGIS